MKFKNFALGALVSSLCWTTGAQAASLSFDVGAFNSAAYIGFDAVEDFEGFGVGTWNPATNTAVGTFDVASPAGTGSGTTCQQFGNCDELYLSDMEINGQGNIFPVGETNALQANDTFGMVWNASSGSAFNEILFSLRDAADISKTVVTISLLELDGTTLGTPVTTQLSGLDNSERVMVGLSLMDSVKSATISIISSKLNDSFTFDAGGLDFVPGRGSEVPLPAAAWLFLSVMGGAGVLRRVGKKA